MLVSIYSNRFEIPEYPNFKKISSLEKPIFEYLLPKDWYYSDFNLLSLISWNVDNFNEYSVLNSNIVIKIRDYLTDAPVISIIGDNKIDETFKILIDEHKKLSYVPHKTILNLSDSLSSALSIIEDRDSFDYVVSFECFTALKGKKFKNLKRHIKEFLDNNPKHEIVELNLKSNDTVDEIIALNNKWGLQKKFDSKKISEDNLILKNFMANASDFNTISFGLKIDNAIQAFTFNEILDEHWIMGHFGKADNSFLGISYYMEYLTACALFKNGYKFLNHQQDAGILGLRTAKLTYAPVDFLKKYSVEIRN